MDLKKNFQDETSATWSTTRSEHPLISNLAKRSTGWWLRQLGWLFDSQLNGKIRVMFQSPPTSQWTPVRIPLGLTSYTVRWVLDSAGRSSCDQAGPVCRKKSKGPGWCPNGWLIFCGNCIKQHKTSSESLTPTAWLVQRLTRTTWRSPSWTKCAACAEIIRGFDVFEQFLEGAYHGISTEMYVCMYVCMYIYIYIYTHIHGLYRKKSEFRGMFGFAFVTDLAIIHQKIKYHQYS